jgi:leader peptidase (prepilin peptidase) / N-methyltransferase
MLTFIAAAFGLIIGSFLNVCIHRLPAGGSIIVPGSHCPLCGHGIPWHDNIPVLSFILLFGKCRFCKKRISLRYIIVEMLTGFMFVLIVQHIGPKPEAFVYMILSCALIIASFIDLQYQIIPDEITYTGMGAGVLLSIALPLTHSTSNRLYALGDSLAGLFLGGLLIYAMAFIGEIAFRKKLKEIGEDSAVGGGDIKYLAMIGSFLGWKGVVIVFFMSPFFGSIIGIIEKLRRKADIIPYGPYLSISAFITALWGNEIIKAVF